MISTISHLLVSVFGALIISAPYLLEKRLRYNEEVYGKDIEEVKKNFTEVKQQLEQCATDLHALHEKTDKQPPYLEKRLRYNEEVYGKDIEEVKKNFTEVKQQLEQCATDLHALHEKTDKQPPYLEKRFRYNEEVYGKDIEEVKKNFTEVKQQLKQCATDLHALHEKTDKQQPYFPIDCQDIKRLGSTESGVYKIFPRGTGGFSVYCDLTTDGGGWTVLQRRIDGSVKFYRKWGDYQYGFGDIHGEYWIGNDRIHQIVAQGWYEARFDLEDFSGNRRYAKYKLFDVGGRSSGYRLTIGDYSGTAGDGMAYHNGAEFYTQDRDVNNCSKNYNGALWYKKCHNVNINGLYLKGKHKSYANGVNWEKWLGQHYSLKSTDMKIRRR